jgi:hypothetical protein
MKVSQKTPFALNQLVVNHKKVQFGQELTKDWNWDFVQTMELWIWEPNSTTHYVNQDEGAMIGEIAEKWTIK